MTHQASTTKRVVAATAAAAAEAASSSRDGQHNNKRPKITTTMTDDDNSCEKETTPPAHFTEHFTDPEVDNLRIKDIRALIYPQGFVFVFGVCGPALGMGRKEGKEGVIGN